MTKYNPSEPANLHIYARDKDTIAMNALNSLPQDREKLLEDLTFDYITRLEKGEEPMLAEYTHQYPDIAEALQENIAYYVWEGQDLLAALNTETESSAYADTLAATFADPAAMQQLRAEAEQIMKQVSRGSASADPAITSIYDVARLKGITPPKLAQQVGVPSDLLHALNQRMVTITSVPRLVITRLGEALDVSTRSLIQFLNGTAIASANYYSRDVPKPPTQADFAMLLNRSGSITHDQREFWSQHAQPFSQEELQQFGAPVDDDGNTGSI